MLLAMMLQVFRIWFNRGRGTSCRARSVSGLSDMATPVRSPWSVISTGMVLLTSAATTQSWVAGTLCKALMDIRCSIWVAMVRFPCYRRYTKIGCVSGMMTGKSHHACCNCNSDGVTLATQAAKVMLSEFLFLNCMMC